jgi:alcohol dehydrogenase (cytochrome c)
MRAIVRGSIRGAAVVSLLLTGLLSYNGVQGNGARTATAAAANVDWPMFGNNTDNNRYSPLTQINASTVSKLGIAWTQNEGQNQTTFETVPLVINGVMYYTTNANQVRAVNAATGRLVWQYTPKVNFYEAIAGGGGGVPTNRGVTVANGKVYLLTFDNQLIALQQSTGEKLWTSTVADASKGFSESSPPAYWNGILIVGSAESDSGHRGFVAGYDAATGKKLWNYYTVPAAGQGWVPTKPLVTGGDVWMPPVVDTKTGMVYVGTGNPYPDFDNSKRPGCNPWVNATVALDARTGKFIWAHSEYCNDIYDYDSDPSPMIFDIRYPGGKTVHAIGHANKSGLYFIYDAKTGKVLAQTGFVTKEQHPKHAANGTWTDCPGFFGGFEYSPAAYSPVTQAVYDPAVTACLTHTGPVKFTINPKTVSGTMAAIDVTTGKFMWRTQVPKPMVGGAVATAGGLVFSGAGDGNLYAFDDKTGKILWSGDLGLGFGAPPITYSVAGTQYIAVADGGFSAEAYLGDKNLGGTLVVLKLNGAPITKQPVTKGTSSSGLSQVITTKGMMQVTPFEYVDAVNHKVVFKVTAALTNDNNGFNFNGYSKGKATFVVPASWHADFIFNNNQALPHSLAVINTLKYGPEVTPLAATPNPTTGLAGKTLQYAGFNALAPGKFYLVCLVPGHISAGMWENFVVSAKATQPSITVSK